MSDASNAGLKITLLPENLILCLEELFGLFVSRMREMYSDCTFAAI